MDLVGPHRQQHLSRAIQITETRENQPNCFLQPQIWIKAEADFAVPNIADRHSNAQLAATRLGTRRVVHSGAQHAEF